MKRLFSVALFLWISFAAVAQPAKDIGQRHQLRIGWGDALFEALAFGNSPSHQYPNPQALPEDFSIHERFNSFYTGHFFVAYGYRINKLVRVGGQMDMEGIFWEEGDFDRSHRPVGQIIKQRSYNLVVMPSVRLEYLHRGIVTLYSGAGAGMHVALDNAGGSAFSPALNINILGVQLGRGHWSGGIELGALFALNGASKVYMLGSRLLSFSLNYAW